MKKYGPIPGKIYSVQAHISFMKKAVSISSSLD